MRSLLYIVLVVALTVGNGGAVSNSYSNSSVPIASNRVTTSPSPLRNAPIPPTTDPRSLITTCGPVPYQSFLPLSIRTLPLLQQLFIYSQALETYFEYYKTAADIVASGISNEASASFFNRLLRAIQTDVPRLFGPGGYAILTFQDINTDSCLYSTCLNQFFDQSRSFVSANPGQIWTYSASAPCCDRCRLTADNVDLEYFPTPAQNPPASTFVDESNFTFVSPSVYARYTNLHARDICGGVGTSIPFTRIAFGPTDLTSSYFRATPENDVREIAEGFFKGIFGTWKQINYADFNSTDCICTTNCPVNPANNVTATYTCKPRLSIHPKVSALDPLWATCRDNLYGFFDPPVALTRRAGLTEPKITSVDPISPNPQVTPTPPPASPSSSPTPPIVTPTISSSPGPDPVTSSRPPANPTTSVGTTISTTTRGRGENPLPETQQGGGSQIRSVTVIGTQTFVIGPSVSTVVVGSSTFTIPGGSPSLQGERPVTINGQVLTPDSASRIVIGTHTLAPGGSAITVSGTIISIAPGGNPVVVGTVRSASGTQTTGGSASAPVEYTGISSKQIVPSVYLFWIAVVFLPAMFL